MADKHEKLLLELEFRMRQLMYLCDSLKEENHELRTQLNEKQHEVAEKDALLEQLNAKLTNLEQAGSLIGADAQGVEKTKKRLNQLVQDVEKCISLLKI